MREPGELGFLDWIAECFRLELGAPQPSLDPHDEDLIEGLDRQAAQPFPCWMSYHLAVIQFGWGSRPPLCGTCQMAQL